MSNRITETIARYRETLKNVPAETQADLESTLDIDTLERATFFQRNTEAHATGLLTLEEANFVYVALKNWINEDLATKITITKLMAELLLRRLT